MNLSWEKEIKGLLKDGFKPDVFKGRKIIHEISFVKRYKNSCRLDGISYMKSDFTQKQLNKILNILKIEKVNFKVKL